MGAGCSAGSAGGALQPQPPQPCSVPLQGDLLPVGLVTELLLWRAAAWSRARVVGGCWWESRIFLALSNEVVTVCADFSPATL